MRGLYFLPGDTTAASLADATTGTGSAIAFNQCRQVIGFVAYDSADAPSTGELVAEWAYSPDYTGTWSNLTTVDVADLVAGTGDPGFTYPGGLPYVRWRFTSGNDSDKAITAYLNGDLN
jgi:hypothetical protein